MAQATETVRLVVNGESHEVPCGITIAQLVQRLGVGSAACAVEVNREIAPKATHEDRTLADGDTIEIVTLVGGG